MEEDQKTLIRILELRMVRLDIMIRALNAGRKKGIKIDFARLEEVVSKSLGIPERLKIDKEES